MNWVLLLLTLFSLKTEFLLSVVLVCASIKRDILEKIPDANEAKQPDLNLE